MPTGFQHPRRGTVAGLERDELIARLRKRARIIRRETVRLIAIARSGRYTSVFSCATTRAIPPGPTATAS